MLFDFNQEDQRILDDAQEYFKDFIIIPKIVTIVYAICCFIIGIILLIAVGALGLIAWGAMLISPLIYISLKRKFSYQIAHIYYLKKISSLLQNSDSLPQEGHTTVNKSEKFEKSVSSPSTETIISNESDTEHNDAAPTNLSLKRSKLIFPNQSTKITKKEYQMNLDLKAVTLSSSVTIIESSAFWGCDNLTSVEIPSSVIYIGDNAFGWCAHLKQIIFNGTIAQWKMIKKDSSWNNGIPETTVVCLDGKVELR